MISSLDQVPREKNTLYVIQADYIALRSESKTRWFTTTYDYSVSENFKEFLDEVKFIGSTVTLYQPFERIRD